VTRTCNSVGMHTQADTQTHRHTHRRMGDHCTFRVAIPNVKFTKQTDSLVFVITAIRLFHCRAECQLCERVSVILSFILVLSCILIAY